jgi:hypothetical protein
MVGSTSSLRICTGRSYRERCSTNLASKYKIKQMLPVEVDNNHLVLAVLFSNCRELASRANTKKPVQYLYTIM